MEEEESTEPHWPSIDWIYELRALTCPAIYGAMFGLAAAALFVVIYAGIL